MLLKKIGQGGMGTVYMARQLSMDRVVALKILSPAFARDKDKRERFLKEAKASAKLHHPNIISIHSAGYDGGFCYYAMEYIEGGSVKDIINKEGKIPEDRALEIAFEIAQGLNHAFQKHLIHRDVKPDNFMITKEGVVKLCDLGLAKILGDDSSQTQIGSFMGTPYYTSPEQAKGSDEVDIRSDLYSLGASLFHMLTGRHPFEGSNPISVITMHINDQPPLVSSINSSISKGTTQLIDKLLKKDPAERFQTPQELMDAIGDIFRKFHKKNKSLKITQQAPSIEVENESAIGALIRPVLIGLGALIVAYLGFSFFKTEKKIEKEPEVIAFDSGLLKTFNLEKQKFLIMLSNQGISSIVKKDKFKELSDIYAKALPEEIKKLSVEVSVTLDFVGNELVNIYFDKANKDTDKLFSEKKYILAFRNLLTIVDPKVNVGLEDMYKENKLAFLEKAKQNRKSFLIKLFKEVFPFKTKEDVFKLTDIRDSLIKQNEFLDFVNTINKEISDFQQGNKVGPEKVTPKPINESPSDKKIEVGDSKLSPEILSITSNIRKNISDKNFVNMMRYYQNNKEALRAGDNEKLIKEEFPETACAIESIERVYTDFSRNIRRLMEGETIEVANVKYTLVKVTADTLSLMDEKNEVKDIPFDKLTVQMLQNYTSSLRDYDQGLKMSVGVYSIISGDKTKGNDLLKGVDAATKNRFLTGLEKLQK